MIRDTIMVKGMSCSHCIKSVQRELSKLGIKKFHVSVGWVTVEYDLKEIDKQIIIEAIQEAGYEAVITK